MVNCDTAAPDASAAATATVGSTHVHDNDTLLARIRQRFATPTAPDTLSLPRRIYRFLALSVRKARADNLNQQAAALAFITIVSLVPLLAALSFLGARWFDDRQEGMIELFSQILPYSEETVVATLEGFLRQAEAIRGIGFAIFILSSMAVFTNIEATINRIWNVPRQRPARSRLLSFTLVLFWGPLVIGATYSLLFYLKQQPALEGLVSSAPVQLIPFIVKLLGLTMLYWLVPYTTVRFRSAFAGGLTAALMLELLGFGFGIYVDQVRNVSLIYGGFGFLLLFMISIQITWLIVLLGSEVAYSLQHADYMSIRRRPAAPLEGSWVAVTALIVITERFRSGQPVTPHELLAERLQLNAEAVSAILAPLLEANILSDSSGDNEGYLLSCDPYQLEISRVFDLYEHHHWQLLHPLPNHLADGLEDLRGQIVAERTRQSQGLMLMDLVGAQASEEAESSAPESMPVTGTREQPA
ncbi:MAG: YhjD/YihY/BrkB family envelope integrity protein [Acidobacteriota bacterium]